MATQGFAPTISQTTFSDNSVSPSPAAITVTGYAPLIGVSNSPVVVPATNQVVVTGFAPTIVNAGSVSASPSSAVISVTGYAPTIYQSTKPFSVNLVGDADERQKKRKGPIEQRQEISAIMQKAAGIKKPAVLVSPATPVAKQAKPAKKLPGLAGISDDTKKPDDDQDEEDIEFLLRNL